MLKFINELTEARLLRYAENLNDRSAADLGKLLFMCILGLEILRYKDEYAAKAYASQTLRYNEFDKMRPSTSDMANLIAVLSNQADYTDEIKVDNSISPPVLQIKQYLRNTVNGVHQHSVDRALLMKLEKFLKIQSQDLRQIRRIAGDWKDADKTQQNLAYKQLIRDISAQAPILDLLTTLKKHI